MTESFEPSRWAVSRRQLMTWSGAAGMVAVATPAIVACSAPTSDPAADGNGVEVLDGFTSRVIATSGEQVPGTGFDYRIFPDGASTFVDKAVPGGWFLTVNHEIPAVGGVSSIRFAPDGTVVDAYSICADTALNCAGGPTPWGTWLTCEEFDWGHVWECDPTGVENAKVHTAMGAFAHEAAAVATDSRIYMTEDRPDGGFYRFTPDTPGDLSTGLLEIATGTARVGVVSWMKVPIPDPHGLDPLCRHQVPGTIAFNGGEGIATLGQLVWFATKGDDRIWQYDLSAGSISLRYQAGSPAPFSGVDNLWIDAGSGALLVAEDGGDMSVVALLPDNSVVQLAHLPDQKISEITGPCFSPDRTRLYFSSQRGPAGALGLPLGVTYEISGPFAELLGSN